MCTRYLCMQYATNTHTWRSKHSDTCAHTYRQQAHTNIGICLSFNHTPNQAHINKHTTLVGCSTQIHACAKKRTRALCEFGRFWLRKSMQAGQYKYTNIDIRLFLNQRHMQAHTYIHTYIHTWIYKHWYSPIFELQTNSGTYIHTYIRTYIRTYVHKYIHTYTRSPWVQPILDTFNNNLVVFENGL